jgi:excisionase family DNA binding protein
MIAISVEAAGEQLGCSRREIFRLLSRGILERAPRVGRSLRIYQASVDAALLPKPKRGRKPRVPSPAGWELDEVSI